MKQPLETEIIAVGTELLLGQIVNTNAQWLSEQLAHIGANTYYHTVVGDNIERLKATFRQAQTRSNVVIVTGGLGPTEDDVSREALHEISGIPIVEETKTLKKIEQFFIDQKSVMTPNNKRQARVFKDSIVLDNKFGMAPGMIVDYDGVKWIFLPGVPREMKQLFSDDVIPYLRQRTTDTVIQSTVLKFIGIGESHLEHQLQDLIQHQTNPTIAPLAQQDGVTIRLTAKAETEEKGQALIAGTKAHILQRVGTFCYGENDDTIEDKVADLLLKHNKKIAAAESLTGGLFSNRLVTVGGASNYFLGSVVCYGTSVKENVLGIPSDTIEQYGTVSEQCAIAMAQHVCRLLDASIGISFTGVAGPAEIENKKVGTVYICIYDQNGYHRVEKCLFRGDRHQVRHRSVLKGYELLYNYLNRIL